MIKKMIIVQVLFFMFISSFSVVAQGTMESRVSDLERRVADLERRIVAVESKSKGKKQVTVVKHNTQQSYVKSSSPNISIRLFTKKIQEAGPGEDNDQFAFLFEFKNNGNKDITAMKGDIILKNLAAEELLVFGINIAKYISSGDKISWYGGIPYDPSNPLHRAVLSMPIEQIVVTINFDQIVYSDGTIQTEF